MKIVVTLAAVIFLSSFYSRAFAADIALNQSDAVAWLPQQTISGNVNGLNVKYVTVYHNHSSFTVPAKNDMFAFTVTLFPGKNNIRVSVTKGKQLIMSPPLTLTLGYRPLPVVKPYALITGDIISLGANIITNPYGKSLRFIWMPGKTNPAQCKIMAKKGSNATAKIPGTNGTYYFKVIVVAGQDSALFETCVIRKNKQLLSFDIERDHATWIDSAVIYEITPAHFTPNSTYNSIAAKLPELKRLGINTIWLQPVYKTKHGGQGYDVTDYFGLKEDFGDEQQLKHLIDLAKSLQMHVLFDFVINHTSIYHSYAQDVAAKGPASHYYSFYQHSRDSAKYHQHYKLHPNGFVTYFWDDLVNLDYNNIEVQQWIIEACKYWVANYDIDGYRFDAAWAVDARAPAFCKRLQVELKSLKPSLFLLAEDKPYTDDAGNHGFDASYDWTADTAWVSQWSWQHVYAGANNTVFNTDTVFKRGSLLKQALFKHTSTNNILLRFTENNDLPRFVQNHSLQQAKMAAALVFALPGVPLIYNGQEIAARTHPYNSKPIFKDGLPIQSLDSNGIFNYYQALIQLRLSHTALLGKSMAEANATGNNIVAFTRDNEDEHFVIVLNLDSAGRQTTIDVGKTLSSYNTGHRHIFTDVLSGDKFLLEMPGGKTIVGMPGFSVRWLLLDKE